MEFLPDYVFLAFLVYSINVVPAFMPPTWIILSFFFIQYHLLLAPVVLIGAVCATLGRITLYHLARRYFHPFLSKKTQENLHIFGGYINAKKHLTIPLFILYAFIPIPSNHVYIAAALSKVHIHLLAFSFFLGRLISYTFWVGVSAISVKNLEVIFNNHLNKPRSFIMEIVGFLLVYVVVKSNWKRLLKIKKK